jgi:trehalose 6-phosphate synthase/phosphatase
LQKWFGHLPITIVSEHGASIRMKGGTWKNYVHIEQDWKSIIRPVLNVFAQRSPGAFIEEKTHTLVWHYRNVDSELGFIRSRELLDNLYHLIRNSPLNVLDGNKVIEIRVNGIDKGAVTKKLLYNQDYDFVLALGDDKTDEDMFKIIGDNGYSIKIGMGHTAANFQLADQRDVVPVLGQFVSAFDFALHIG